MSDQDKMRFVTAKGRVSYPHLFEPKGFEGQAPKFSVTLLFPKAGFDQKPFVEAITAAKTAKFGPKQNWPKALKSPIGDGDSEQYAGKEGYKGHWVVKATAKADQRPTVVDEGVKPILDPSKIYAGCFARAALYAFGYDTAGNKGVSFILNSIQKMGDGESLSGRKSAEETFAPISNEGDESFAAESDEDDDDGDFM